MRSLHEIQSWLTESIICPPEKEVIPSFISEGTTQLKPQERLAIYGEAYYGRLHQVMQMEFPALRHAMEADLFEYFVTEYLKAYPPTSYSLTMLGINFPKFLRETRPQNSSELWPEFLINLAELERTFQEVFHDEAGEKYNQPETSNFKEIQKEQWTRELQCSFPVHAYFLQYKSGAQEIILPEPAECIILVYRRNYQVQLMHRLASTKT